MVWLDHDPQAGHEQAGRLTALVLSPKAYNAATGLMLCCPVTNQMKGYPFGSCPDRRGAAGCSVSADRGLRVLAIALGMVSGLCAAGWPRAKSVARRRVFVAHA